ncbi:MAG: hydroxyacylglutathione hydrolase [Acidobacteria bacterium]|nr:hydroxyacylglutathione hydrolase [Acidobacteriota bacterium]
MEVTALPALGDNYIFMLCGDAPDRAAAVDPGDARPVLRWLEKSGRRLESILITHHHPDHTAGIPRLRELFPGTGVCGGAGDRGRIPGQARFLSEGDAVPVCGAAAGVLEVPGHTRGHIAYFFDDGRGGGDLFSGDTVFGGTIGNLFEGTPDDMFASLQKIRALPGATRIWCAHEYTLQFVREAARVDPDNERLGRRLAALEGAADRPTVPLALAEECATNPFFRWDAPGLCERLGTAPGIETFRRLCAVT